MNRTVNSLMLVTLMCASLCAARSVSSSDSADKEFNEWVKNSMSETGDMETEQDIYKETEIDIDFPDHSRKVKVIIDDIVESSDENNEHLSSFFSSNLISGSQNIELIDELVKKHVSHLLRSVIERIQEIPKDSKRHHHHKSERRPRSRPKRSLRNALKHVKDTDVAKILKDYFSQKQGENKGIPMIRYG